MSITAYTGLPGSGKSYGVVENVIIPALKSSRIVYTNIPMNNDALLKDFNFQVIQFSIDDILKNQNWFFEVFEAGSLLVIDELSKLWSAGLKANQMNEQHKEFLAEHRHLVGSDGRSTEIVFVTQDLNQIAAFPRGLIEYTYRTVKLSTIGATKKFRVDIFQGPACGPNPPLKNRNDYQLGKYKKQIYQYYISHTRSKHGIAGDETKSDDRFNFFKSGWFKYFIIFILVLLYVIYIGSKKVKEGFFHEPSEPSIPTEPKIPLTTTEPPKPTVHDILTGRDLSIIWNNGTSPDFDFIFRAFKGSNFFDFKLTDIDDLGYKYKIYNQCLVSIKVNSQTYFATCTTDDKKNPIDINLANI